MAFWNAVWHSFVQIYQAVEIKYCLHPKGGCKYFFRNVTNFRSGYPPLGNFYIFSQ